MSEKRFTVDKKVAEDMYSYILRDGEKLCLFQVVDLLNSLSEENEHLQEYLGDLEADVKHYQNIA